MTDSGNTLHATVTSDTNTVSYIPKNKQTTKPKKQVKVKHNFDDDDDADHDNDVDMNEKVIRLGTVEDVTHTYTKEEL